MYSAHERELLGRVAQAHPAERAAMIEHARTDFRVCGKAYDLLNDLHDLLTGAEA